MYSEMKVAVVCIARNEEKYCHEWIDHYIKLGVDKIFWGDNNRDNIGTDIIPYISEYINNGIVEYVSIKNINGGIQTKYYNETYRLHKNEYDWFLFVDIDEFLILPETNNDIKTFLSLDVFNNVDVIRIPWKLYDDNDLLYYEDKPVMKRFTRTFLKNDSICCKCFIKGVGGNNTLTIVGVHMPHEILNKNYNVNLTIVNNDGTLFVKDENDFHNDKHYTVTETTYNHAHLNHYRYKTILEYFFKLIKGRATKKDSINYWINYGIDFNLKKFYTKNLTEEKIKIFKNLWKTYIH